MLMMPYFMKTKIPTEYRMEGTFVYPLYVFTTSPADIDK